MKYEANNLCILSGDELNKITRFPTMAYTMLYRYPSTYFSQSVWFWRYTVARRPNNWNVGYKPILIVVLHHRIPTPTGDSATFANKQNLLSP